MRHYAYRTPDYVKNTLSVSGWRSGWIDMWTYIGSMASKPDKWDWKHLEDSPVILGFSAVSI